MLLIILYVPVGMSYQVNFDCCIVFIIFAACITPPALVLSFKLFVISTQLIFSFLVYHCCQLVFLVIGVNIVHSIFDGWAINYLFQVHTFGGEMLILWFILFCNWKLLMIAMTLLWDNVLLCYSCTNYLIGTIFKRLYMIFGLYNKESPSVTMCVELRAIKESCWRITSHAFFCSFFTSLKR